MSEWNTNLDEAPRDELVLLTLAHGDRVIGYVPSWGHAVAWMPLPEPYKPVKPKQLTDEDLVEMGVVLTSEFVEAIEKRTREIVAWEQEHGDE